MASLNPRPYLVNPFSKTHGAPSDSERHVGDLGNIKTDAQGDAKGSMTDNMVKLIGPESVLGVWPFFPTSFSMDNFKASLRHDWKERWLMRI